MNLRRLNDTTLLSKLEDKKLPILGYKTTASKLIEIFNKVGYATLERSDYQTIVLEMVEFLTEPEGERSVRVALSEDDFKKFRAQTLELTKKKIRNEMSLWNMTYSNGHLTFKWKYKN